jgi:diguanylate cyclase (GGDEF)-like protein/PAS domain S-box-containing protein
MPGMSQSLDPEVRLEILDTLQTAVVAVSLDGKIIFWNDGAERITGYLRHEVLGHKCTENFLLHCDQRSCELCGESCPRSEAQHSARTVQGRNSIHHKSGERVAVHSWVGPVRNSHGTPVALAFSFEGSSAAADPDRREDGLDRVGLSDPATGLANHDMMRAHLRETLSTFHELHVPFAVLRAQLTGLEHLRSTHGQAAVTAIFPAAAHTLENALRPSDFVGRWGPEEFLAILTNCQADSLHILAERVHKMMERAGIEFWGEELSIPVSVHIASAQPGDTMDSLLARAASPESIAPDPTKSRAAAAGDHPPH